MNKKTTASLLAIIVAIVMLSPALPTFAVEEETQTAVAQVKVDPESDYGFVEEKDKSSSASDASFEEISDEEIVCISGEEVLDNSEEYVTTCPEEEPVLGALKKPMTQKVYKMKSGYLYYRFEAVNESYLSVLRFCMIYDTTNKSYLFYDGSNVNMAEEYCQEYTTETSGEKTEYYPVQYTDPIQFAVNQDGTIYNDHFVSMMTEEAYNNMSHDDWINANDLPIIRTSEGIGYYSTRGGAIYSDSEIDGFYQDDLTTYEAYLEDYNKEKSSSSSSSKESSSSSSEKDSSSSSNKDSSSSSKDTSSSSSKDSSSSSEKDSSSSSSKDSSSSSQKDSSSSSKDSSSSSSEKDTSSSSSANEELNPSANVVVKELKVGSASYELKATKSVPYDGKKHVAEGMKTNSKTVADIKVEIVRDGKKLEPGTYKLKFKNNSNGLKKKPYFKVTLGKGYDKAEKKALSKMSFNFDIAPLEVEAKNFKSKKPATVKGNTVKAKLIYKMPDGKYLTLKKTDYSISLDKDGKNVTITMKGNFSGKVTIPLSQLQ